MSEAIEPQKAELFKQQNSLLMKEVTIIQPWLLHHEIVLTLSAVEVDMSLSSDSDDLDPLLIPSPDIEIYYNLPEEEIAYGPA